MHPLYRRSGSRRLRARLPGLSVLVLALLVLSLPACDFGPAPANPTPAPTTLVPPTPTVPDRPRTGTIFARLSGDALTLNPWFGGMDRDTHEVTGLIFSGLTRLDNRLLPQPDLAERWEVSEDGLQITFHLRRDVRWHDGEPFTAQDVVWSYATLRRISAENTATLHIQERVRSVEAVDPVTHTVRFTLNQRYSPILADLSLPVLPSHILSGTDPGALSESPFSSTPVGTGPFAFETRQPGESVTLKAVEDYYGQGPLVERFIFVVAPDNAVAEEAVRDGTLTLAQLSPGSAERLVTGEGGFRGGAFNELGYDFVAFNLREGRATSDTRVRQAFALALDKQGLSFEATGGGGDPVWSDINKASWAYNPSLPQLNGDPERARALLSAAGWTDTDADGIADRDGKPLELILYVRNDNDTRRRAALAMVDPLARVGIRLRVELADFNTVILGRISPTARPPFDFDAVMLGWTRTSPDPDSFALFHSSQVPTEGAPALLNIPGFQAPEYDALSIEARSTYDFARRKELYDRMQEIVADQLPYYFLWSEKFGLAASPTLKGDIDFGSPRYLWNANTWWLEE